MARLVLHVRYYSPLERNRSVKLSNLMNYYGTREGVEKPLPDEWKKLPASEAQKDIIQQYRNLLPELGDTHEWEDYVSAPTQGHAMELLNWVTEQKINDDHPDIYLNYIAKRPRTEKLGAHGLFSMTDEPINLHRAADEVAKHSGIVWTMVFSLRREDAERLGYNNAKSWRELCRSKAGEIAAAMKIPFECFHWYAAFHNESHHPHIHMVAYSKGQEGYLNRFGIEDIKSSFARNIFNLDLEESYQKQTLHRNELRQTAKQYLEKIHDLPQNADAFTNLIPILFEIKRRMPRTGKTQYGYMPNDVKNLVDEVVNRLERNPKIAELYELWYQQKRAILSTYTSNLPPKEPLAQNAAFRPIKNVVLAAVRDMDLSVNMLNSVLPTFGNHLTEEESLDPKITHSLSPERAEGWRLFPEWYYREDNDITPVEEALSVRAIETFLYRLSKVFEDNQPVRHRRAPAIERKSLIAEEELKESLGMHL